MSKIHKKLLKGQNTQQIYHILLTLCIDTIFGGPLAVKKCTWTSIFKVMKGLIILASPITRGLCSQARFSTTILLFSGPVARENPGNKQDGMGLLSTTWESLE